MALILLLALLVLLLGVCYFAPILHSGWPLQVHIIQVLLEVLGILESRGFQLSLCTRTACGAFKK